MALSEFDLIERHFARHAEGAPNVVLGVGDDCALLKVPEGMTLAVSVDTSVAGVHFPEETAPADIGYRSLAVNLSDLAAMGAEPSWFTLALTLEQAEDAWLEAFSSGLFELADRFRVPLVGGDVTRGRLSVCIEVGGLVPDGKALLRSGARPGDAIYVTGTLGDAAAALALRARGETWAGVPPALRVRVDRPSPRVAEGLALRDLASACIDVSDGIAADLGHILARSAAGARIEADSLPRSAAFREAEPELEAPLALLLGGGDDYELCFCVPPEHEARLHERFAELGTRLTRIGTVESEPGLRCMGTEGRPVDLTHAGYRHF